MLKGNKVYLRTISDGDTDLIIKWRNNDNVRKNFIFQEKFTKDMHESWLKHKVYAGSVVQFIIMNYNNEPVGSVFLRDIDNINHKAEFGIFIGDKENRNKGFGNESARLIIDYGFTSLELNKIFLRVLSENSIAINSYKRVGFTQEGYFKEDVFINNKYCDVIFMSILKSEWRVMQ